MLKINGVFHSPDLIAHALSGISAFSLRLMLLSLPLGAAPALTGPSAPPLCFLPFHTFKAT